MSCLERPPDGNTLAALAFSIAALAFVGWIASSGDPPRLTPPGRPATANPSPITDEHAPKRQNAPRT